MTPETEARLSLGILNFVVYGGLGCITPFLSLHLQTIGLTMLHTIYIHVASGLVCVLVPLVLGSIAEKKRDKPVRFLYKSCLALALLVGAGSYMGLLAVKPVHRVHRQPHLNFDCSSPMNAILNIEKCANFETCGDLASAWTPKTRFRLSNCIFKYTDNQRPDPPDPLLMCFRSTANNTHHCLVYDPRVPENPTLEFTSDLRTWLFTEYRNVSTDGTNICSYVPATSGTVIKINKRLHDAVSCQRSITEKVESISCYIKMDPVDQKRPDCFDIIGDLQATFWWYLGMRALGDACIMAAICLMDAISLRVIESGPYNRGVYGRSRLPPVVALALFPLAVGLLVDYISPIDGPSNYSPAFFAFGALEVLAVVLLYPLPVPVGCTTFRYSTSQPRRQDTEFHLTLEMKVLCGAAIIAGTSWGFSQVFDPFVYSSIHFKNWMMGLAQSIAFLCAIPFLSMSKNLLMNIGEHNLLCVSFIFHTLHLAGLSVAEQWTHWWWSLPFEAMKAFTIPIMWLALVALVELGNVKGKRIGMHYILIIVHYGTGRLLACLVGGITAVHFSLSLSYVVMSLFSLIGCVVYFTFHHSYMKPRSRRLIELKCELIRQAVNNSKIRLLPINGAMIRRAD